MKKIISLLLITGLTILTACTFNDTSEPPKKNDTIEQKHQEQKYGNNIHFQLSRMDYEIERDENLEIAIKKFLGDYNKNSDGEIKYFYNKIDLNDDKKDEVFVMLVGPYTCGTGGCSAVLFEDTKEGYKPISEFTLVNNPVIISENKTNGWKDIIMYVSGGGTKKHYAILKYNNGKYPSNPSVEPEIKSDTLIKGTAILYGNLQNGIILP